MARKQPHSFGGSDDDDLEIVARAAGREAAQEVIRWMPRSSSSSGPSASEIARALVGPQKPEPSNFLSQWTRDLLDNPAALDTKLEPFTTVSVKGSDVVAGRQGWRLPNDFFRDMTVASAPGGGHLVSTTNLPYLPALQAASACLQMGVQPVPVTLGSRFLPRGTASVTTQWLSTEATQITESTPTFGQAAASPKILGAYVEVSRQLALQSDDSALRSELIRAAGAEVDRVIIQGSGASGQPLGVINTAGIGAFTGASLDQAAARNAQADVVIANANVGNRLGYLTTPAVADLLARRQRFTGSDRALWEGSLVDGVLEGERAMSTNNVPTATAVYADWSTIQLLTWSDVGLGIMIDPFTKFQSGIVGFRLLMAVDVIVSRASAISVATSIT
jgi:HK97 family phage major capsid protein